MVLTCHKCKKRPAVVGEWCDICLGRCWVPGCEAVPDPPGTSVCERHRNWLRNLVCTSCGENASYVVKGRVGRYLLTTCAICKREARLQMVAKDADTR